MKLELEQTTNHQTYDVLINENRIDGEITNVSGDFNYQTDRFEYELSSAELRAIADKLDELNGGSQ